MSKTHFFHLSIVKFTERGYYFIYWTTWAIVETIKETSLINFKFDFLTSYFAQFFVLLWKDKALRWNWKPHACFFILIPSLVEIWLLNIPFKVFSTNLSSKYNYVHIATNFGAWVMKMPVWTKRHNHSLILPPPPENGKWRYFVTKSIYEWPLRPTDIRPHW